MSNIRKFYKEALDRVKKNSSKRLKGQFSDQEQGEFDVTHETAEEFSGWMEDARTNIDHHIAVLAPYFDKRLMSTLQRASDAIIAYIDEYESKIGGFGREDDPPDAEEYYEKRFYE